MKDKIKTFILYAFVILIALLVIASIVITTFRMGTHTFDFIKNAILTLGNGNIFVGILLTILLLFGLTNAIIGMFSPPRILENAPSWGQTLYFALSLFGTVALFYVIIEHIL